MTNQQNIGAINFERIFEAFTKAEKPLSVTDIIKSCHLSAATISRILRQMIEMKLILEDSKEKTKAGRNRSLYVLNHAYVTALAILIDKDQITFSLVDFLRNPIYTEKLSLEPSAIGENFQEHLYEAIMQFIDHSRHTLNSIYLISICVSGQVRVQEDRVYITVAGISGVKDVEIRKFVQERTHVTTHVEKDVVACLVGASLQPEMQPAKQLVFMLIHVGIGSAVMIDGSIYRGMNDFAGEIRNMAIGASALNAVALDSLTDKDPDNQHLSHLEDLCGIRTIKRCAYDIYCVQTSRFRQYLDQQNIKINSDADIEMKYLDHAVQQGDEEIIFMLYEPIILWAGIITNIYCCLAPEKIILGGEVNQETPHILHLLRQLVKRAVRCDVEIITLGDESIIEQAANDLAVMNVYQSIRKEC